MTNGIRREIHFRQLMLPFTLLTYLGACGSPEAPATTPATSTDGHSFWSVTWPRGWETMPAGDPADPIKVRSGGALSSTLRGTGWATLKHHGVVIWPDTVVSWLGVKPDTLDAETIDQKKALVFEYDDAGMRFMGCAVERGDALVYVAIGCPKANFEEFRQTFAKVLSSVRCAR